MTLTEIPYINADGSYDRSAILREAWARAGRQHARLGCSKREAFALYLGQVWCLAQHQRAAKRALTTPPHIIREGTRAWAELATDGRLVGRFAI